MMIKIKTSEELEAFCKELHKSPYIAVDTEFLREKTYRSILCLIQLATPTQAACVDVLAPDMDLTPLLTVLESQKILKIFHSARQDLEIFYDLMGKVPAPLFDTQIGAMVCGLGENVSYHNLVYHFLGIDIDKASRVTDWSKRPLSDEQLEYAVCDVTYLIQIYPKMVDELKRTKRLSWVDEETQALGNPKLYVTDPMDAWHRIKPLSTRPQYLGLLQALCAWREKRAALLNRPRRHVMRDETILELAALAPVKTQDLQRLRSSFGAPLKGQVQEEIIKVVQETLATGACPHWERPRGLLPAQQSTREMLKLVLNLVCAGVGVAPKLIASSEDLDKLAIDSNADVAAMKGWRRDIFGQKALDFKEGKLGIVFDTKTAQVVLKPVDK